MSREQVVKVGIADFNVVREPNVIRTSGLGSCIGVVIYDLRAKLAGMAHIMLPDSTMAKGERMKEAKYADTAIPLLMELLKEEGGRSFKAKLAGGAQMFQFSNNDMMRIGPRNLEAVKKQLKSCSIPVVAEDCGGSNGRTIEFDPSSGIMQIRTVNKGVTEI
ncbi:MULTISPECIES: chemotaxis protein CheD [Pontibacillus]|uniref:Probable chemoreceptor glutamine deamidase CheD n=1 Tax=Pontibacillus chungwhensis TaxID=265426 RepID=A0ABY8V3D1_9BACI|nr:MULTISPECIES: chemotaxis protein CheD [Pontibacillus]MCD5322707.1 chemotaxis protein CheD [Pontibacillus sp. HN14]WIF99983.1 chemotaxis protein CheD [Pontibacillus chungwhensis]